MYLLLEPALRGPDWAEPGAGLHMFQILRIWGGPFSTMADEEVYYPTSYCTFTSQMMSEIMIFYSYGSYKDLTATGCALLTKSVNVSLLGQK
jgi:hypothetical protein